MAPYAMSFTYWVDPKSCTGDKDVSAILKETQSMATRAKSKMESNSDSDFANLYKFIFKKDKSDSGSYKTVHGMLQLITPSKNLHCLILMSDVRLHVRRFWCYLKH